MSFFVVLFVSGGVFTRSLLTSCWLFFLNNRDGSGWHTGQIRDVQALCLASWEKRSLDLMLFLSLEGEQLVVEEKTVGD